MNTSGSHLPTSSCTTRGTLSKGAKDGGACRDVVAPATFQVSSFSAMRVEAGTSCAEGPRSTGAGRLPASAAGAPAEHKKRNTRSHAAGSSSTLSASRWPRHPTSLRRKPKHALRAAPAS